MTPPGLTRPNKARPNMSKRMLGWKTTERAGFAARRGGAARRYCASGLIATALVSIAAVPARAQLPSSRFGEVVPRDVREMYDHGLQYLATTQGENGDWPGGGGENGPGTTGMALMVFLACGEDPNFGPYSNHVRRSLRNIISSQDSTTGIMGMSMYHHGFAMLALAEAYGAVDERNLWPDGKGPRSIGQALELAVRAAITSQKKNPSSAWRCGASRRGPGRCGASQRGQSFALIIVPAPLPGAATSQPLHRILPEQAYLPI